VVAGFLVLSVVSGQAAEPKPPEPQKAETPKATEAIPIAEVTTRALAVSNFLGTVTAKFASGPEIETIKKSLPETSMQIDRKRAGTVNVLQGQLMIAKLQVLRQQWQDIQVQTNAWLNVLTQQATLLQDELNRLADLQKIWTITRSAALTSKQPKPILQQINQTLTEIDAAQTKLQVQRTAVLELQTHVANEVERCVRALEQLTQFEQGALAGILVRDSRPIWSGELWADGLKNLPMLLHNTAAAYGEEIQQYVRETSRSMPLYAVLFIALVVLCLAARRQIRQWEAGEGDSPALMVFEYPIAAALVIPVLVATAPSSTIPAIVKGLVLVLGIVSIILLTRPVINPRMIPLLYVLGILVAVDVVRQTLGNVQLIRLVMQILETVAALGAIVWWLRRVRPRGEAAGPARFNILRLGAYLSLFILAVGLVAGASGYVLLASLVTTGILALSALALALYAGIRVLSGLMAFALRVWPLRTLEMVKQHRALLERRVYGVLVPVAIATWVSRFLALIGLRDRALSILTSILYARLERGSISISLVDVLAFVITVWIASLVSSFIRFALQEDVFPRMRVAPGSSYAISSLLHYVILAFGVVVGLGVMGVNLTSVSVLAGAFGVGIGFGLQSVVNNFISGLILLFEQPVHVGDTIEVGDLQGEIRHIGIRASIVRTWHGSDIIVPNAQFITEKVTNWTLRDQLRRIDLPVGVNYGAAPKQVIELLENVAEANPRVLRNPPPKCLFMSYGDSSINFELRAWTDQFYNWQTIRSEMAVAIYDAVYAAGMTFPFPQRDVHIVQDAQPDKKKL